MQNLSCASPGSPSVIAVSSQCLPCTHLLPGALLGSSCMFLIEHSQQPFQSDSLLYLIYTRCNCTTEGPCLPTAAHVTKQLNWGFGTSMILSEVIRTLGLPVPRSLGVTAQSGHSCPPTLLFCYVENLRPMAVFTQSVGLLLHFRISPNPWTCASKLQGPLKPWSY